MTNVLWLPSREFLLYLREIEGACLAFHSGTGQTHLLSTYAAIVISFLSNCASAMSAEELKVSGKDDFSELTLTELNQLLESLFELHFITKIGSN